jgi:sugar (pentulose or hexulose) kinase
VAAAVGIDVGTTNVKAVLVDDDGVIQASAARALRTDIRDDAVTQDAGLLWDQVVAAVREVTDSAPASLSAAVTSVGVCSQYSSIVPVDAEARPVGPMILWQDRRGTDPSWGILAEHPDAFDLWVERHGIPPVGGGLSLGHLLVLEQSSTRTDTASYLEPMDYVVARLTGRIAATQHSMFMSQLCDNRHLGTTGYDPELLTRSGLDPERLPPLVAVGTTIDTLLPTVAEQLGLPAGAAVSVGTNDTSAGLIATGALADGRGGLSIGTTTVLIDGVDAMKVDLDHEILSMPGPLPGDYLVWAENGLGGRVVEKVLDELLLADDVLGSDRRDQPFDALNAALDESLAGANGVLCLPWFHGSLAPRSDPEMRGAFLNVSLETTRVDLVRAATEATAHNLGWLLPHVETFIGHPIREIGFVGGAARSDPWCQIIADILDRPITRIASPGRAIARGTALLARHCQGQLTRDELQALADDDTRFEPDATLRGVYDHRQGQFEAAFDAVAPIVNELANTPEQG